MPRGQLSLLKMVLGSQTGPLNSALLRSCNIPEIKLATHSATRMACAAPRAKLVLLAALLALLLAVVTAQPLRPLPSIASRKLLQGE